MGTFGDLAAGGLAGLKEDAADAVLYLCPVADMKKLAEKPLASSATFWRPMTPGTPWPNVGDTVALYTSLPVRYFDVKARIVSYSPSKVYLILGY